MRRVKARAALLAVAVTTTSLLALVSVACDLDLKPYVDPVEGGIPFTPTDSGGTSSGNNPTPDGDVPLQDAGSDATVEAGPDGGGRKRVFVTSTVTSGNMNGVEGANALCMQRAAVGKLAGNFTAWISINNNLAINRLPQTQQLVYFLVDQQTMVFANRQAIVGGAPSVVIDRDESNVKVQAPQGVWTGTQSNGTAAGNNCSNFTQAVIGSGLAGNSNERDEQWTQDQQVNCQTQLHLYCFEL